MADGTKSSRDRLRRLRSTAAQLASDLAVTDSRAVFGELVGSLEMRSAPVHRWFTYKEGFSPRLLDSVLHLLEATESVDVIDPFGGVGTTALSAQRSSAASSVRSLEYSPFAHFVANVKRSALDLDAERLGNLVPELLDYNHQAAVQIPSLSTLANPDIFSEQRLRSLLAARDHIATMDTLSTEERSFFLLGFAAVLEDLSGAMKDGRALRLKGERNRRKSSLASDTALGSKRSPVRQALKSQWNEMIKDVGLAADLFPHRVPTVQARGDARCLDSVLTDGGRTLFEDRSADVAVFSPPYLNFLDYTELYKIELWLMGFVSDAASFRETRLGTLRSHPSLKFPDSEWPLDSRLLVSRYVDQLGSWLEDELPRRGSGRIAKQYFEDMYSVFVQVHRTLRSGGTAVCIVANSTFSRRTQNEDGGTRTEDWRLPVPTDVVLARLAEAAGFSDITILEARDLRARNVAGGAARESLIVARR